MGQPPNPPVARKLSAAELFDTVEVDLWGSVYTLRTITRTVSTRLADQQEAVQALSAETSTTDELAYALIDLIDVLLEPTGEAQDSGPLLRALWEKDELGLDFISGLAEAIQAEAQARKRPTSATRTSG